MFLSSWLADYPVGINELWQVGLNGGDAREDLFQAVARRPLSELTGKDISRLRPLVHRNIASRPGITFMKTHSAIGTANGYPTINPDVTGGAIYVIRDPRDVAVSFAAHYGLDIDTAIEHIGSKDQYITEKGSPVYQFVSSWSGHAHSWLDAKGLSLHLVKYEDMKARPGPTFNRIVEFLGHKPRGGDVRRAIANTKFSRLREQEEKLGFRERSAKAERFFRQGSTGGWRAVLTAAQVRRIERDHSAMMARLGYTSMEMAA